MLPIFIEILHTIVILTLVGLVPFLFVKKWKILTRLATIYSVIFITINRMSQWILGECILTRMARWVGGDWNGELFIVKTLRIIIGVTPSNIQVFWIEDILILIVILGILFSLKQKK
jgi:hypothetical protein